MSLLLLRSLGSSYLFQGPGLLLRPPGFRSSYFSSLRRLAPHQCWPASGSPSPWRLLLLVPSCSPACLLFTNPQNTSPGISSHCFSTLSLSGSPPFFISSPGSGSVSRGGLLMDRSSRDRPPPSKRWKSTGDGKGEKEGRGAAARSVDGAGGKASETRPGKESHSGRDRPPGAPRSKSWSDDRSGEGRKWENLPKRERNEESRGNGHKKKRDWEDGDGRGRATQTHQRMDHPPRPRHPPQPHTVEKHPNPWHLAGAPRRTYPHPPPGGVRRNPGPPPKVEMSRNSVTGTRNTPPPPGTLRTPVPPPPSRNPPPATGAWGNPPPATGAWGNPPPVTGAWGNPPPATGAWGNPPPATGAWGNPPSATLRAPTPPPPGTLGNHEDFPPLSSSSGPPQRIQSKGSAAQPLQRHWDESPASSTGLQPTGGGGGFDFSVMSYNILSQDLLQDNAYLYRHCDPRVLPWDFRLPNLLREILQYDADVLCLQEVQQDHYQTQMKPALEARGYQCVYKKRTGNKPEGCAIVFKSSRLTLVSAHPLEYLRPGDALLDRDNVGLVLLLRPVTDGQSDPSDFFCVANTHLLYNPRRGDIKLAQLAILLAEISRLSRLPDGSANPVVVCGDFNSVPWSPLYCLLTQGCLEFKDLPIGLVSGQEDRQGQRVLTPPIWSKTLGINQDCCYDNQPTSKPPSTSPTEVKEVISTPTVEHLTANARATSSRTRLRHGVGLMSSYSHLLMPDGRAEVTTCHSRTAMTVDYILYTPDSTTKSSLPGGRGLQLLARLSLVGLSELKAINGLPNQHHSSDHLPIVARFRLR